MRPNLMGLAMLAGFSGMAQGQLASRRIELGPADTGSVSLELRTEPVVRSTLVAEEVPEPRERRVPRGPDRRLSRQAEEAAMRIRREPDPGTAVVTLNTTVPAGEGSVNWVAEPTVAQKDSLMLYTANHFAALSIDAGNTFKYLDPEEAFRGTGETFCCDQVAIYVPAIDMFVWSLQARRYRAQVILYARPADARSGKWKKLVLTPKSLGVPDGGLDFTELSFGSGAVYWSSNVFGRTDRSVIVRISNVSLTSGSPAPEVFEANVSARPVQQAGSIGYFAAHENSSTVRVYAWREQSTAPTYHDVPVPNWNEGMWSGRVLGATQAGNDIWLAWTAAPREDRPLTYVQIARVDNTAFALQDSPDLWSPSYQILFPALTTNPATGEVAASYFFGVRRSHAVGFLTNQRVHIPTAQGGRDKLGDKWGHYLSIRSHYGPTAQATPAFIATGYTVDANQHPVARLVIFSRPLGSPP